MLISSNRACLWMLLNSSAVPQLCKEIFRFPSVDAGEGFIGSGLQILSPVAGSPSQYQPTIYGRESKAMQTIAGILDWQQTNPKGSLSFPTTPFVTRRCYAEPSVPLVKWQA